MDFSASYVYPAMPDILWLPQWAILVKVSPDTHNDLTCEETKLTAERSKTNVCKFHCQDERNLHYSYKLSSENVF
jgi:hypothetical protein